MQTHPVMINGLAGPLVLEAGPLSAKYTVTVGGYPAQRTGRNRYALPVAGGGMVEATLRSGFFDPYPSVMIDGIGHRTGPKVPVLLRVLSLLPFGLVGVGGLIGGLIGALGVLANLAIIRTQTQSLAVKTLAVLGVLVVTVAVWLVVAMAVRNLIG